MRLFYGATMALLVLAAPAAAQTPLTPGQQIATELEPGRMQSGTTTVPRPDANIIFEYRINNAATPIAAAKAVPCVVTTAPTLTCRLVPPTLPEGTHTIEVRALASPAEPGVTPSPYSSPLSVAVILVTSPARPTNTRLVTP